ncbi:hypothetical protein U9M48_009432, partial [Paspalum notatum var. saurae]
LDSAPRLIFCRSEEPFVFTEDGDDEGNEVSPLQVVYLDSIDFGDRQVLGGMPQIAVWKHDMIKLYSELASSNLSNENAVDLGGAHCTFWSLGQSLRPRGFVNNFVLAAFCRHLFLKPNGHPDRSKKHYFYTVSMGKMNNLMNIFPDGWVTLTPCEVNYLGLRYGACDRLLYVVTDGVVEFDKIYRIIRVVEEITGSSKFKVCRDHAGNYFVSYESLIDTYKFDHAALSVSK